ncbi:hypothetical protein [Poseidonibacter ostreae]|uniref:HNH nuclease domain-containing protein n=1 Tax=Poseidonibacter ostreae TaxID=2654171 RepID=A0ABQ6VNH1_9BACT|nr:hypothetical protein [Poseidonibacter ostreae]KAB7886401.1 hypothetical protein GA417_05480 [Poseidonibacter ostreae]KAB7891558.1 hypothetical protein GBG18_06765 [Poseidonibacter ostreae]
MFYTIEKVDDHPCIGMQSILNIFFQNILSTGNWSISKQHHLLQAANGNTTLIKDLRKLNRKINSKNNIVKQTINHQFINNNKIEELCFGTIPLEDNIKWDIDFGKEIKSFFDTSYPSKLDLSIFKRTGCRIKPTKRFYQDFILKNGHVCPFCSILTHKNPFGKKRGDFDHYLDKTHYPFSSLNLDNLIPMCTECNQDYKHTDNLLKTSSGIKRKFIYPYSITNPFILVIRNMDQDNMNWKFNICIFSNLDYNLLHDFDDVFNIGDRIKRELSKRYDKWIKEEVKRYIITQGPLSINGFKKYLLDVAKNVIDINDRTIEATLLQYALFIYLGTTINEEVNDIFLGSFLFNYI